MPTQHQIYRAILQGCQITWLDPPPELPSETEVYITIASSPSSKALRGQAMAAALEKLSQIDPFIDIALNDIDPIGWQRETRQDRPLPGRE
ncbi:hypothetical protein [Egbenema bharatensis]|uniref:hypothetical protein n=1 Tax=Egbenema bharatensis TaxID=3463334 RepID=UPI003A8B8A54